MRPNLHYFIYVTMESLQSWYTSTGWYIGTHGLLVQAGWTISGPLAVPGYRNDDLNSHSRK